MIDQFKLRAMTIAGNCPPENVSFIEFITFDRDHIFTLEEKPREYSIP